MVDNTLLVKSINDYKISVMLINMKVDSEEYLDTALYHMQQAIEKCLKFFLVLSKVSYRKTHNIAKLLQLCEYEGLPRFESIRNYEDEITAWDAQSRYEFYDLEDISIYYAVLYDYCNLFNYVSNLAKE